jgi:hypothetical protein
MEIARLTDKALIMTHCKPTAVGSSRLSASKTFLTPSVSISMGMGDGLCGRCEARDIGAVILNSTGRRLFEINE